MFHKLIDLLMGPVHDTAKSGIGNAKYFGLVLLLAAIVFLCIGVPVSLVVKDTKPALGIAAFLSLCFGATAVESFEKRKPQVSHTPIRGGSLGEKKIGE